MPELPEVETIKNELLPHIVGHCITGVTLFWDGIVRQPSVKEFCSRLIGQRITGVNRRGKYLIFGLNSANELIIHLRMTGSLLLKPASAEPEKFVRAILHLEKNTVLHFNDPRKLGAMWLIEDEKTVIGKLGAEPLEASFTPQVLAQQLSKRTAPIKALLCDQTIIAGIGNMYADEALHAAKIHPLRKANGLSSQEIQRLYRAINHVLLQAISKKGASIDTYKRPSGENGTAHHSFHVAHQGGKPCPSCGTIIQRLAIRNRGCYFCPNCQPELYSLRLKGG